MTYDCQEKPITLSKNDANFWGSPGGNGFNLLKSHSFNVLANVLKI
jgi:hypothetical protein